MKSAHIDGSVLAVLASLLWDWGPGELEERLSKEEQIEYSYLTGSLSWLANKTRPDLRYVVMRLQHRSADLSNKDLVALHNALRYLKGCPDLGLVLGGVNDPVFFVYVDASYIDWPNRKSTEGCIWLFAGGPVA